MSITNEVTAVNPKNIAEFRRRLMDKSDGELDIQARNTDNAAGVAASEILFERREKRAKEDAELADRRHRELLTAIKTPHWSQTPGFWFGVIAALSGTAAAWYGYLAYQQSLQPSAQAQQAFPVSTSASQISASSPPRSASSPASQSSLPKK